MQTISTQTRQATAHFNGRNVNEPLLRLNTDVVVETLTKCYMANVAFTGKPYRDAAEDINKVARWLTSAGMRHGLIISGGVGTGKTTLARAMWMVMQYHGAPAKGVPADRIGTIYKTSEQEEYYRLKNASRLFIDDLGTEYASVKNYGEEASPMLDLINTFHRSGRTLIITTNLTEDSILERYGSRIASRLFEMCEFMQLTNNQDYRKL